MTAAPKDLKIEQGATYRLPFQWCAKNPDGSVGAPHDITGWSARMQIREKVASETFLLEATTGNGRIALGGADGRITIVLDAETTMLLAVKKAVYDLELADTELPVPNVYRLLQGSIVIDPNTTR